MPPRMTSPGPIALSSAMRATWRPACRGNLLERLAEPHDVAVERCLCVLELRARFACAIAPFPTGTFTG